MKDVKVLGPGCKRCDAVEKMVTDAASALGIEISVEKISDYAQIAGYGIASTPTSSSKARSSMLAACRRMTISSVGWQHRQNTRPMQKIPAALSMGCATRH